MSNQVYENNTTKYVESKVLSLYYTTTASQTISTIAPILFTNAGGELDKFTISSGVITPLYAGVYAINACCEIEKSGPATDIMAARVAIHVVTKQYSSGYELAKQIYHSAATGTSNNNATGVCLSGVIYLGVDDTIQVNVTSLTDTIDAYVLGNAEGTKTYITFQRIL